MFTIKWDTEEVRKKIERISTLSPRYIDCIDLCTSICVSVDGIYLSGRAENSAKNCTELKDFFLGTLSVFRSIDPDRLHDKPFHFYYNVDNCVLGERFRYYVRYDRTTDLMTFEYIYTGKKIFQTLQIPLREFANGVILSAEEMIAKVLSVSTECEDTSYHIFKADLGIIKDWYREMYGVDADRDHLPVAPALDRRKPGIITTDYPGAVQIIWNRAELEDRTRKVASPFDSDPYLNFEMGFHLFIDDVDVIGGGYTFYDSLFSLLITCLYRVIEQVDPDVPHLKDISDASDVTEVSGPGFDFHLTLQTGEMVLVDYRSAQMGHRAQVTVPLKRLVAAVVQGNEELLLEAIEIWPDLVSSTLYHRQADDNSILREWYREKYHEELPQLEIIV